MPTKISFLVHDIHAPTVGAAVRLAMALDTQYEVEIVGPDLGRGVCSMYAESFPFKTVSCPRLYRWPDFIWESRRIEHAITGDIVVALKAYMNTLPVALNHRRRHGGRVVAYLDEWDGAIWSSKSLKNKCRTLLGQWKHPMNESYTPWVERKLSLADERIVTTSFLQRKFGGQVVPLGVDATFFKPQPTEVCEALKKRWGLQTFKLLGFGGVVRAHKGLETILEALVLLNDPTVLLLILGPITDELNFMLNNARWRHFLRCIGAPQTGDALLNREVHDHMPEYLGMCDILMIPLADTLLAWSQLPSKVFEAMAMAKPIIAGKVSDLPMLLHECGWVVPPGDPKVLAQSIRFVLDHPAVGREKGIAARVKCIREYSQQVTSEKITAIFDRLLLRSS